MELLMYPEVITKSAPSIKYIRCLRLSYFEEYAHLHYPELERILWLFQSRVLKTILLAQILNTLIFYPHCHQTKTFMFNLVPWIHWPPFSFLCLPSLKILWLIHLRHKHHAGLFFLKPVFKGGKKVFQAGGSGPIEKLVHGV